MINKLQILAEQSYKSGNLDEPTVNYIAEKLSRNELKQYIKLLKLYEDKKQVLITTPKELDKKERDLIEKRFENKSIVYAINSNMITGIKITDYDKEYEISLNQIFHDIITYLSKYDRQ